MKKKFLGVLALAGVAVTGITLASCGSESSNPNEVTKDIYGVNADGNVVKTGSFNLLFKEKSEIPYVNVEQSVDLISELRSEVTGSKNCKYSIEKSGDNYVISNERGAKCTIDPSKQTITYDDYDKFTSFITESQDPLVSYTVKSTTKAIKEVSHNYTKGKTVTYDLNNYSALDIYKENGCCYLPLSVFNTTLFNTNASVSFAYNGTNLFALPGMGLSDELMGQSALSKKFYEGASKSTISEEYSKYNYQSVCFDFDCNYGLKSKFGTNKTFDEYLKKLGYNTGMSSTNPKEIDNYTSIALSYLEDGHTALSEASNMYPFGTISVDKTKVDPYLPALEEGKSNLKANKTKANIKNGISYSGNTAFVTFDTFTVVNNDLLYGVEGLEEYKEVVQGEIDGSNTAVLFNKLYSDLTSNTYKDTIKNVVIDLTTNDGGEVDGLIYALSTLIGNVSMDLANPMSGAICNQVYKADMNADGKIDSSDKSLIELGFNIYFLDSKYSFSSANAMPVLAKINNSKVVTLGQNTGGGPCAVRTNVTPIGSVISSSSLSVISKLENGSYVNIDGGVAADYALTESQMIDRDYIVSNIASWKK